MQKQICFNKKIQPNLKWKKIYHHPIVVQYIKKVINLFPLYSIKKINKTKEKKFKRKKIKLKIS
jgi:hypothetical protein